MPSESGPLSEEPEPPHRSPDLDAVFAALQFDPHDPLSVQAAIQEMDTAIDAKLALYGLNPDVQAMADARKAVYRQAILDQARIAE